MKSIPIMGILTMPIFLAEIYGYSQLHDQLPQTPVDWIRTFLQVIFYLVFTDCLIYWIHRYLHHPILYGPIHKLHHKWVVTTPFASHAFHPMDGFLQSTPYHIYVFLFPMNKLVYLALFALVNFWTISIHDGAGAYNGVIINGADHHVIHHRQFNYNYGQYFTFWDRLCGTHRAPPKAAAALGKSQ
jgi:lathosterol oxidase